MNELIKKVTVHNNWRFKCANPFTSSLFDECLAEILRLRQGLWDCYAASGADTDGDKTPSAVVGDLVKICVSAVKELRDDYSEAIKDALSPSKEYVPMTEEERLTSRDMWLHSPFKIDDLIKAIEAAAIKRYKEQMGVGE